MIISSRGRDFERRMLGPKPTYPHLTVDTDRHRTPRQADTSCAVSAEDSPVSPGEPGSTHCQDSSASLSSGQQPASAYTTAASQPANSRSIVKSPEPREPRTTRRVEMGPNGRHKCLYRMGRPRRPAIFWSFQLLGSLAPPSSRVGALYVSAGCHCSIGLSRPPCARVQQPIRAIAARPVRSHPTSTLIRTSAAGYRRRPRPRRRRPLGGRLPPPSLEPALPGPSPRACPCSRSGRCR